LSYSPLPKPLAQTLPPRSKSRSFAATPAQSLVQSLPRLPKPLAQPLRPRSKSCSIATAPAQSLIQSLPPLPNAQLYSGGFFFCCLFLPVSLLQFFCFIYFQFFVPLPELCFFNFVEDYCLYLPLFDTGRLNLVGHFYLCIDSHYGHFYLVPLGFVFDFGI
jgi:hypothetical protein